VLPEHYPIVGGYLLQAIGEVLGADTATPAVIDAWAAAYQQLADLLIEAEASRYDTVASTPGGWRGARAFRVSRRVRESSEITSFYLAPVDGKPVIGYTPGQYIGLRLRVDGKEIRRNYSLSEAANGATYRISVKREPGGVASNYLHDHAQEGTQVDLFPPSGQFTLTDSHKPLVLISGGVGITATLAMAQAALETGDRLVVFIHYARSAEVQAFKEVLQAWRATYPQFNAYVVHAQAAEVQDNVPDAVGYPATEHLQAWLPGSRDVDAYFLGPKPFMAFMKRALQALGVPEQQTRYEFFGPAQALV
jgi:nitric oxide dioxygenase